MTTAFGTRVPGDYDIECGLGGFLNLDNPQAADVHLADVALGLARTCRFAGQCGRFYSVAEHTLLVASKLEEQGYPDAVVLRGLHHDDSEAYLGDMTAPLKGLVGEAYRLVEDHVSAAIAHALRLPDLTVGQQQAVKEADYWALAIEAHWLMPSRGVSWWCAGRFDGTPLSYGASEVPTKELAAAWLRRHEELAG